MAVDSLSIGEKVPKKAVSMVCGDIIYYAVAKRTYSNLEHQII